MREVRYESKRTRYEILRQQLSSDRSSFIPQYRDINDYIVPSRGRFFVTDVNRGDRRNQKIIDSSGTFSANTLASGMVSGVTSPARPWFRLGAPDPDLNDFGPVKEWTYLVAQRMNYVFLKSNLYKTLPSCYRDNGIFGTAPISVEDDFENVIHTKSFPVGSYYLAVDEKGKVNVFVREYAMTVRNLISTFGKKDSQGNVDWSNFSTMVRNCYDRGQYETWINIVHVISPNEDYVDGSPFSKQKKFSSCYYEKGYLGSSNQSYMNTADDDKYLRESGFDYFPILGLRWLVTGEDAYGTECPGMVSLGDIKQLQHGEKVGGKALDKMVDPPMVAPISMQNSKTSILSGDITFADTREGMQGYRPAHTVNLQINHLEQKQAQVRQRISRAFYEDLFLMLSQSDRREITAREIDERHEEKLLALGPVLEQLNQDLLDPLIDITFSRMVQRGMIPPAPRELQGVPLRVEYISIMAQAQKMIGIGSLERFTGFVTPLLQLKPDVADKINFDHLVDVYGSGLSLEPGIIRPDDEVASIRQQKAQQQQHAAMAEAIPQMASAAKSLSQSDMGSDNALTRLTQQAQAGQIVNQ